MWRHEIRLLQALSAYPGGREYLAPYVESGQDERHFLLALGAGPRVPLSMLPRPAETTKPSTRNLTWRNIRRLAKGLEILHSHGLVHRNLGLHAVLSSKADTPDFQLSGFEWGIRLRETHATHCSGATHSGPALHGYSFSSDWRSLAELATDLLGAPAGVLDNMSRSQDAPNLTVPERRLLQDLLTDQVAPYNILEQLDRIIGDYRLNSRDAGKPRYFLIYDGATEHTLWKHLPEARNREGSKLTLLRSDLKRATLMEVKQRAPRPNCLVLLGRRYTYYLKEYGADGWTFPHIDLIERSRPEPRFIVRHQEISLRSMEISAPFRTDQEKQRTLKHAQGWRSLFPGEAETLYTNAGARDFYDSFVVLHLLEMLYQAAHAWTLKIQQVRALENGDYTFTATVVSNEKLRLLSAALDLEPPNRRLVNLLERDTGVRRWHVASTRPKPGKPDKDIWRFAGTRESESSAPVFHFTGPVWFAQNEQLLLRETDHEGQDKLMRRRAQLLESLKEHADLTEMLAAPRSCVRASHDPPAWHSPNLDASKQTALSQMCAALPFYALQGPPGTGKTHLVTELVRQRIAQDPTARLLITSQGHDAVDHLMREVIKSAKSWPGAAPLFVRARGSEDPQLGSQAKERATQILAGLRVSDLVREAPQELRGQLEQLQNRVAAGTEARIPDKALESLLLRAANIVFSSTNSADLKLLLDSLSRFDWSMIEEAGRATGNELLAPLMLSHRRLLIGDTKQLPPFGEERIVRLLGKPEQLRRAFQQGHPLIKHQLRDLDVEYLFGRHADAPNVDRLCQHLERALHLFGFLHRETYEHATKLIAAGRLNEQYRMHPALARIVADVFYNGDLETAPEMLPRRERHLQPFYYVRHAAKLDSPLVMVRTPYAQVFHGRRYEERSSPAYHNPIEVDAVVEVLASIRARPTDKNKPSLVILTPYNAQTQRLARRIAVEMQDRLAHLNDFELRQPLVHTIDSFQGDEADVVIASLVRNNGRGWYKGLGILGDPRRMNVLLSRARWTTLLVGSLDFLKRRFPPGRPVPEETGLGFLKKLIRVLSSSDPDNRRRRRGVSVIGVSALLRGQRR